ncbi:MAG: leucine-rich repeat protein [Oscillospiraceae bacterium]
MNRKSKLLKRALACFLAVLLVVTSTPLSGLAGLELPQWSELFSMEASAAAEHKSGYYTYTVSKGKATITNCDESISGKIVIPEKLGGYPVTIIGDYAFYDCSGLTSITIPDGVTSIGDEAFFCCFALKSITIPDSVTDIGFGAFNGCIGLIDITIPDRVTYIGDYAFSSCSCLTNITIPDGVTRIGSGAFDGCTGLTRITIPDSVNSISYMAFSNCENLKDVYYTGTEKQWKSIDIDEFDNDCLTNANIHYNHKSHTYKTSITPATMTKDGKSVKTCSVCGSKKTTVIYKASAVKLSKSSFTYNGKVQKPTLTVKDSKGDKISSKYYTATWSNTSSKNVGTYKVTIKFKGNYTGTKTLTYKIAPKQVTGLKVSSVKATSLTLTWSKVTGAKYYKLEKSTDGKKWTTVTTTDKTSYTVKSLKAGTKYQFRVTALDSTKKIAGKSSAVLKTATLTGAPSVTLKSSKSKTATASWKKVTGASKYVVYKSTDGKKWTKVTTTTKTTYTFTKLTGGKKIYVKVTALNAYGKASASSTVKNVTVKK